jgi:hypothetical protein
MKFKKIDFFEIFDLKQLKYDQICIQIIEFIFQRSNLSLNGPIRS